jgi:chorismate--pyruvate lyase
MHNHQFPISLAASWATQQQTETCSDKISSWLYDENSLTKKLESLYTKFQVQVKQQLIVDSSMVGLSGYFANEKKILLREVFLYCDETPVVFAQTEIPFSTLSHKQAQLTEIGNQSLGTILFQDINMKRGPIEVAQFTENQQLTNLCQSLKQNCPHSLWARRSQFFLNDKPLLVSELFLPALGIYQA